MISYTDDLAAVREDMLHGFFVGWLRRPSAAQHLAVLRRIQFAPAPPGRAGGLPAAMDPRPNRLVPGANVRHNP